MHGIEDGNEAAHFKSEIFRFARLAENKTLGPEIADRLVLKALDKSASVDVRVAAIYAVKSLQPGAVSKLAGLLGDPDDRVGRAMVDIGAQ